MCFVTFNHIIKLIHTFHSFVVNQNQFLHVKLILPKMNIQRAKSGIKFKEFYIPH